jgi:uncharacterized protein (TIGR03437 family)
MRLCVCAVLAAACACSAFAQIYTVKTFAGGALPENVAGLSASLGNIAGIAADTNANIYLSLSDYGIVVRSDANTGVLTRVAGTGINGFSGDGGPAVSAQLSEPAGLAFDSAGNLYIADAGNNRIRKISNGVIFTYAGNGNAAYTGDSGPAASASFNGLGGIAFDSAGNLYVADFYDQAVRMISSDGTITTVAGNGTYGYNGENITATNAQLAGPMGVAVDYSGSLYIAESYNNRVRKVTKGIITTYAGTGTAGMNGDYGPPGSASLHTPTDLAIDSLSNLYIADYGNNRIRMVAYSSRPTITTVAGNGLATYAGDHVLAAGAGLTSPQHIAADSAGNLYIADGIRARKVSQNMISTMAGGGVPTGENGPAANAQLAAPQAVTVDSSGNIFIADEATGRILKVSGTTLTRVAGSGTDQGPTKSGTPATSAQLGQPSGVAVSSTGDVYVTDLLDCRLLKISNGIVSQIASGTQLNEPNAVAIDGGGNLYLADLNRIRMIANGIITTIAGNGSDGYQGDGAIATAAELAGPSGVTVDSTGNIYLTDYGNNRVRMVSNGNITTIAGNGTYGFSGSGGNATSAQIGYPAGVAADAAGNLYITDSYRVLKVTRGAKTNVITTIAGLNNPQGIAVDASGNVYVAEPATHRVRILSPSTGTTCAVILIAPNPIAPVGGGTLSFSLQTGANCSWTVESLPTWITVAGSPFGTGSGTITLNVAANNDVPRSATMLAGGQSLVIGQLGNMTINGQITTPTSAVVPGVSLNLTGAVTAKTTSDSGGNFAFTGFTSSGTYTVTPTLAGYAFLPASQTFTYATSNPAANFTAWAIPQIGGIGPVFGSTIVPAPSGFAAGETVAIYGANLCSTSASAAPTLPDRLAACVIQVDGVNVHPYYAGPAQVNVVLPQSLTLGSHQLVVQRYTDTSYKTMAVQSASISITVNRVAMAFAERADCGNQILLVQNPDGSFIGSATPLQAGKTVILYLTGLGKKAQTFAEGAAPKSASAAVEPVQVTVQGVPATVAYAGAQSQFPGIDQMNVQIPNYTLPQGKTTATIQFTAPTANQTVTYEVPAN